MRIVPCVPVSNASQSILGYGTTPLTFIRSVWNRPGSHLERLDGGDPVLLALVVVATEGTLELGAAVVEVERLLDGDVAPVRHLDDAQHVRHREERRVVLVVDRHRRLQASRRQEPRSYTERYVRCCFWRAKTRTCTP